MSRPFRNPTKAFQKPTHRKIKKKTKQTPRGKTARKALAGKFYGCFSFCPKTKYQGGGQRSRRRRTTTWEMFTTLRSVWIYVHNFFIPPARQTHSPVPPKIGGVAQIYANNKRQQSEGQAADIEEEALSIRTFPPKILNGNSNETDNWKYYLEGRKGGVASHFVTTPRCTQLQKVLHFIFKGSRVWYKDFSEPPRNCTKKT